MVQGVYLKKYNLKNYFVMEQSDLLDTLYLPLIPADGFPVFDIQTEAVGEILQYQAGKFVLDIPVDGGYTSSDGDSIYNFFKTNNDDVKYLVIVFFGKESGSNISFSGTFTEEKIDYSFTSRRLGIRVLPIQDELAEAFSDSMVGTLDQDRTVDNWLEYSLYPQDILDAGIVGTTKSFTSYATLIGSGTVKVRKDFQNAGAWINSITSWQGFLEIMQGTGLMFKVRLSSVNEVSKNIPHYDLHIFSLSGMTSATSPRKFGDPKETMIFKNKKWLYINYRRWDWSGYDSGASTYNSWEDGVISDGINVYSIDTHRPQTSVTATNTNNYPAFVKRQGGYVAGFYGREGFKTLDPDKMEQWDAIGNIPRTWSTEKDLNVVDLPKYVNGFNGAYNPWGTPLVLSHSQRHNSYANIIAADNYDFKPVQEFAISQYKRYIGKRKRQLSVTVLWGDYQGVGYYYDIFQTVSIYSPIYGTINYYIARIENLKPVSINNEPPSCELTLIEV